jgi:hypothetical protein
MRRKAKKYFPIMWNRNTFFHKCFLKKINVENPSHPPPPIRKWLLPNKVIGTKLQLVPVVEVCLYWPTPFLFP